MRKMQNLLDYIREDLPHQDINRAVVILHLLENGGRATKEDLIYRLSRFNHPVRFFYEAVLNRVTELDLAEQDVFTYDEKTENYFLNVSMRDTYLKDSAIKSLRATVESWLDNQQTRPEETASGMPKLVRDQIPAQITADGRTPVVKHMHGEALQQKLIEKLTEEHIELLEHTNLEEIGDMIEVLLALAAELGHDEAAVMEQVHNKRSERGGFGEGTYLTNIHEERAAPRPTE
jgi:predicted house-cleaning noncanonical NTP pyrophosphatase (MazG superfamily)